jgi:hypothetical protein
MLDLGLIQQPSWFGSRTRASTSMDIPLFSMDKHKIRTRDEQVRLLPCDTVTFAGASMDNLPFSTELIGDGQPGPKTR